MPLSAGVRLGPYEILALIGAGGMGEVYRARDTRLGREVAIKICNEQFSERFEREARSVAALNHPNICQLYDVGPNYLVMELIEGHPLRGPLSTEKAVEYAIQILDALDAAHRKGITHRDLKPANILLTKSGIKLLDFGLAKRSTQLAETDVTSALTQQGQIVGTLQYMSPEQLQGRDAGPRSDLFSFGCMIYEMLTGKGAFDGQSAASVIAAILERPAPSVANVAPLALDRVLKRCLEKDPDLRFQTARDLKAAIEWAVLPAGIGSGDAVPSRLHPWFRRAGWIAAAILVLGGVGGWTLARLLQPPASTQAVRLQLNPPPGGQFLFGLGITPGGMAVSPDGRSVAFVASVARQAGLWLHSLDGAAPRLLAGGDNAGYPFWAPDSRSVAFFANGKLQRIDLPGGALYTVCDVDASLRGGGTWTNDGYILLGTMGTGLFRVPESGGTPSRLPSTASFTLMPQVLPGGSVLYFSAGAGPETQGLFAGALDKPGKQVHLVTTASSGVYAKSGSGQHYLLWLRGSTLVAQELDPKGLKLIGEPYPIADPVGSLNGVTNVSASNNGVLIFGTSNLMSQFSWLDRTGKVLSNVGEPGEYNSFRLTADGRRVVVSRNYPQGSDLWLLDTERGVANRFTANPGIAAYPVWSRDSAVVVFSTGGPLSLFSKAANGVGEEERLTQSPSLHLATDWSRDGHIAYFEVGKATQEDIWTVRVAADGRRIPGADPKLYIRTPFRELNARFSPEQNPRWIAYMSNKSGQFEVYIDSFPEPGHEIRVSSAGGSYPEWNDTGNELLYVSPDYRLMSVRLKSTASLLEPSVPRELFRLPAAVSTWSPFQVAPGGQRFLVRAVPEQQGSQPLTVIVNWPKLLKGTSGG